MCRIASIFFLQRLKESMSGDASDCSNMETRAVIKSPPPKKKALGRRKFTPFWKKIRGTCTIVCHRKNWVAQFKCGDSSTCDAPRPGRPKIVTTPEIIDRIHELIWKTTGFRLNQQLSNWASQVSGLGPSFIKISTCGSSPRSGPRNAWTRITNVNGASRLSNFGIFSARS